MVWFRCYNFNPTQVRTSFENSEQCGKLYDASKILIFIMFWIGVLVIVSKIFIGINLLQLMKRRLNAPYNDVKKSVIVTIIASSLIIIFNAVLNFVVSQNFSLFWGHLFQPFQHVSRSRLIWEAVLEYVGNIGEVFLMGFTAQNIDFKAYIIALMFGRRANSLVPKTSIFLYYHPKHQALPGSTEGSTSSDDRNMRDSLILSREIGNNHKEYTQLQDSSRIPDFQNQSY